MSQEHKISNRAQFDIIEHSVRFGMFSNRYCCNVINVFGFGTKKSRPSPKISSFHSHSRRTSFFK